MNITTKDKWLEFSAEIHYGDIPYHEYVPESLMMKVAEARFDDAKVTLTTFNKMIKINGRLPKTSIDKAKRQLEEDISQIKAKIQQIGEALGTRRGDIMNTYTSSIIAGVFSRSQIEHIARNPKYNLSSTLLISILNPPEYVSKNAKSLQLQLLRRFHSWLIVRFWDVEVAVDEVIKPISDETAEKIARFILMHKNHLGDNLKLMVHCEAGISRSPAVAMAAECIVLHNCNVEEYLATNPQLLKSTRYMPNKVVFNKIVSAVKQIE